MDVHALGDSRISHTAVTIRESNPKVRDLWLRNGHVRERISSDGERDPEIYDLLPVLALCLAYDAADINATLCSCGRGQ